MGTQLLSRGLAWGDCGMLWNLDRPDDVSAIHRAYRAAGCDLVTTNSFGGSRFALDLHGLADRRAHLNRAAAQVARAAVGHPGWVLGNVGPCGDFLALAGGVTVDELRVAFHVQMSALIEGGADAILVETLSDPAEAVVAVEAAKACNPTMPVLVTYTFLPCAPGEFRTLMGARVVDAVRAATAAGADVVGANCGIDLSLDAYVVLARQLVAAAAGGARVMVQPNAGSPIIANKRTFYRTTPQDMAATATQLLDAGVRIVGGCCGTTPAHLAAMSQATRHATR